MSVRPNLFIVGAAKAGTTSLFNYLQQHPQIFMSPLKEPNFFGSDIKWEGFRADYRKATRFEASSYFEQKPLRERHIAFIEKREFYLKLFENQESYSYRGEGSTSYLFSERAAQEIYDFNPEARILIVLREPVDRALSHYFMDLAGGGQTETEILSALTADYEAAQKGWGVSNLYIELGLYYKQLQRYFERFPKSQICVVDFKALTRDTAATMKMIFDFLELDDTVLMNLNQTHNKTLVPKNRLVKKMKAFKAIVPAEARTYLQNKLSFLFNSKSDYEIPEEVLVYLRDVFSDDWNKTQTLIKGTSPNTIISNYN